MTVLFPSKPNIVAVVELAGFTSHFRVLSLIRIVMGITDDTIYISKSCAVSRLTARDLFNSLSFEPPDSIPENCFFQISFYPRVLT